MDLHYLQSPWTTSQQIYYALPMPRMRHGSVLVERRYFFEWLRHSLSIFTALAVGISVLKPEDWPFLAFLITISKDWSWLIAPSGIALAAILEIVLRKRGNDREWQTVHDRLDKFHAEIFGNLGDLEEDHRVTLFKHVKRCPWRWPPWGGFLLPVERSGSTTSRRSRTVFRAPDSGKDAEGIAGLAWASRAAIVVNSLDPSKPEDYGKRTKMSKADVQQRRDKGQSLPRSMCGFRVLVAGGPWGVIVLDSQKPDADYARVEDVYKDKVERIFDGLLKGL